MIEILRKVSITIWSHKWEAFALYIVHLLSSFLVGIKIKNLMSSALGNSTIGKNLAAGYDSNTMTDLIRHGGMDLGSIGKIIAISLPIALLLSTYVSGGVIANISNKEHGLSCILKNGWKHIGKFLLTSLITLLTIIVLCSLVWGPFLVYSGDPIQTYDTEKPFILLVIGFTIFSALITSLVAAWSVKAKSLISLESDSPFRLAFRWLFSNITSILVFTILTLLCLIFLGMLFTFLISICNGGTTYAWLSLILGQLMIYTICKLRVWYYSGLVSI